MNHLDDVPKKENFMMFKGEIGTIMLQHVAYWLRDGDGDLRVHFVNGGRPLLVETEKAADFEAAMQRFADVCEWAYRPMYVLTQTPPAGR